MIVFEPSIALDMDLKSINEMLQTGLEKNELVYFCSGNIAKAFILAKKREQEQECKKFIELIKKIFFLKKAKLLPFKLNDNNLNKILYYNKEFYLKPLMYLLISYLFLEETKKNINFIDTFVKEIDLLDRKYGLQLIMFIKKVFNYSDEKIEKVIDDFINFIRK